MLSYTLKNPLQGQSIELNNNRLSRLHQCKGKCEVTGETLEIGQMELHHKVPKSLGGNDEYKNLVWVSKDIHKLIHATTKQTIDKYKNILNLSKDSLVKLNKLRSNASLKAI